MKKYDKIKKYDRQKGDLRKKNEFMNWNRCSQWYYGHCGIDGAPCFFANVTNCTKGNLPIKPKESIRK